MAASGTLGRVAHPGAKTTVARDAARRSMDRLLNRDRIEVLTVLIGE